MNLGLSGDELLILRTAQSFALKRLSVVNHDVDERGIWPEETLDEMRQLGLFGIIIPEAYGGFFISYRLYYSVIHELAKVCASHALILLSHSFSSHLISSYGNSEQKATWLPKMATGEFLGAVAMTEPDAGSDLAAIKTSAVQHEDGFILNGHKQFITNGNKADVIVVLTSTSTKNPSTLADLHRPAKFWMGILPEIDGPRRHTEEFGQFEVRRPEHAKLLGLRCELVTIMRRTAAKRGGWCGHGLLSRHREVVGRQWRCRWCWRGDGRTKAPAGHRGADEEGDHKGRPYEDRHDVGAPLVGALPNRHRETGKTKTRRESAGLGRDVADRGHKPPGG